MRDPATIITFGIHKGKSLSDQSIPDRYIYWLAGRGKYQDPNNRFETLWKCPIDLAILARREWESRTGERWEG